MKSNRIMLIAISVSLLSGCGRSESQSTAPQLANAGDSDSCYLRLAIPSQVDEHLARCSTQAKSSSLLRYYRALKSLEGTNTRTIARELITLRSWTDQIATLTGNDTRCASQLLCGGNL